MSDIAIRVENLSKRYLLGHQANAPKGEATLRDNLVGAARGLLHRTKEMASGGALVAGDSIEEFWALKDVSFEVKRGEVVGVIGRNGAGKSTLLKILSRLTEPTSGRITLNGRVSSLLEVGTGFHPELSGRENIFLNGAILGMNRKEIQAKFDEIVDFAEVERFLDTPVKRYSSGMYVRLAFAVAAHLEPEILILDEVLSVGDVQFQKKCLGKMSDFSSMGRTVLFVSHDLSAVLRLCPNSILLKAGQVHQVGDSARIIDGYKSQDKVRLNSRKFGNADFEVEIENHVVETTGDHVVLKYDLLMRTATALDSIYYAFDVLDPFGVAIGQAFSIDLGPDKLQPRRPERRRISIFLPPLIPGSYTTSFWMGPHNTVTTFMEEVFHQFEIEISPSKLRKVPHTRDHGSLLTKMYLTNVG